MVTVINNIKSLKRKTSLLDTIIIHSAIGGVKLKLVKILNLFRVKSGRLIGLPVGYLGGKAKWPRCVVADFEGAGCRGFEFGIFSSVLSGTLGEARSVELTKRS